MNLAPLFGLRKSECEKPQSIFVRIKNILKPQEPLILDEFRKNGNEASLYAFLSARRLGNR